MYKRTDEQDPADKHRVSPSFTNLYAANFALMHRTRTPIHHTRVSDRNIIQIGSMPHFLIQWLMGFFKFSFTGHHMQHNVCLQNLLKITLASQFQLRQ